MGRGPAEGTRAQDILDEGRLRSSVTEGERARSDGTRRSRPGRGDPLPFLPFTNHLVFRRVMRDPETAKGFLERVLRLEIEEVVYCNTEQVLDMDIEAKSVRLDLYVKDAERRFNVEMQCQDYSDIGMRMAYYQSAINADAMERGCAEYELPESYIVFLCADDPFGHDRPLYTFEASCKEVGGLSLHTGSTWLVLNAQAHASEPDERMRNLLSYVRERKVPRNDPLIERIDAEVRAINEDGKWVERTMRYLTIEEHARSLGRMDGRREGRAEGFAEGEAKGLAEGRVEGFAEGEAKGIAEGIEKGEAKGEARFANLVERLLDAGRVEDVRRASADTSYRDQLFKELSIA